MADINAETSPDRGAPPPMPRWFKIPLIVIGVLAVLLIGVRFVSGDGQDAPGGNRSAGVTDTDQRGDVR